MPPAPTNGNPHADLVLEVATYLAAGLNMTLGQNLFVGRLPEPGLAGVENTSMDALYIKEMPGPAPNEEIDTETYLFDIWTSSPDTANGKALLRSVYDILQRKGNYALTNWYVYISKANSTIRDEPNSREGSSLHSQGWTFICRNLNNLS